MKRIIASLLIAAQLAVVAPAFADPPTLPQPPPPVPGEVDVGAAISPMKKGQVAPFTGILLSPKATATIIAQLNTMQDQIKIEVDHARAEEKARCDFRVAETENRLETDKKILQAQVDEKTKTNALLTDQLKKAEESRPNLPLWVGLGTGVGLVVGVGVSALAVYATSHASK